MGVKAILRWSEEVSKGGPVWGVIDEYCVEIEW